MRSTRGTRIRAPPNSINDANTTMDCFARRSSINSFKPAAISKLYAAHASSCLDHFTAANAAPAENIVSTPVRKAGSLQARRDN
jgi:hypothetical protein